MEQANLTRANLTRANFKDADLTSANLTEANFENADLENANLENADLEDADLEQANLETADLTRAKLIGAYLGEANLIGAYLGEANLIGANLTEANLTEANLTQANLSEANLSEANLTRAYLKGANLTRANFEDADLEQANLTRADLGGVINLDLDKWRHLLSEEQIAQIQSVFNPQQASVSNIYGSDASEKPTPIVKANIIKEVKFYDPVSMDVFEGTIEDYIKEDKDNMVIVYRKTIDGKPIDKYFLTNRKNLNIMYENNENTVYPCKETRYELIPSEENIIDTPYFDLHKLGFVEANEQYCDMKEYDNNKNNQLFAIVNLNKPPYPSFVSHRVRSMGQEANVVGEQHCQEGQGGKVCKMIVATPSTKDNPEDLRFGGKKKKRKTRKVNRKRKMSKRITNKKKIHKNKKKIHKNKKKIHKNKKKTHKHKKVRKSKRKTRRNKVK